MFRSVPAAGELRRPRPRRLVAAVTTVATAMVWGVALTEPAQAVRPGDPPDADRSVVLPRVVARATSTGDQLSGTTSSNPAGPDDVRPSDATKGPAAAGYSAAVANGNGTFWALADGDAGQDAPQVTDPEVQEDSGDSLRIHLIRPRWERAGGGRGSVQILRHLTVADPYRNLSFPIANQDTKARQLTTADLDVESLQRMPDGTFWIGEERGPYLIHVDRRGRVLSPPVPFPPGGSPLNPELEGHSPATQVSGGFEATAMSQNGRYLYPILERALVEEDDGRRRVVSEFDTRRGRYTGRTWDFQVDTDANLVADAQMIAPGVMLVLERDDFAGEAAVTKRVYRVDLDRADRSGMLAKRLVADLLKLDNPALIGDGDGWGTGDPFSFGLQSVETLVPLSNGDLMIGSDDHDPGSAARRPGTTEAPELIIIDPESTVTATEAAGTVIAHRGASGYRPEHTLAAYALAIRQCADVIEPDIVLTKDNVPVARHENEIGGTTDVALHPEFANRRVRKIIDGESVRGWFTEDFTLAELRTLRTKERIPDVRPANTAFNGKYPIPTLAEVLDLARHSRTCSGQPVGITPETKHPTYFASIGRPMETPLLEALTAANLNRRRAPVVIQSFEVGNLQRLNQLTPVGLSQLVNCSGAPYDLEAAGDPRTYATMATAAGLAEIATYADVVGFCKNVMIPRTSQAFLRQPSTAIRDAHAVGLQVIGWTFRRENSFLPADFRIGTDPAAAGDLESEIRTFLAAGMDGYFTDNPDIGSQVEIDLT